MTFDDSDVAYRYVPLGNVQPGELRPSSMDVKNSTDGSGMSVVMHSLLEADGRDVTTVAPDNEHFAVFAWTVRTLRDLGFDVVYAPVDGEPAHANVVKIVAAGEDPTKIWSRSVRRTLIEAGRWAIPPSSASDQ